ncbi:MAG: sodium:proton antiporter [Bacteroidetes bacterium 4572_77]|nr:MAG: sodium:proton antiporter [Bacteroidetes bacterium 4572_77]
MIRFSLSKFIALPFIITSLLFLILSFNSYAQQENKWHIEKPLIVMQGEEAFLEIYCTEMHDELSLIINGKQEYLKLINGKASYAIVIHKETNYSISSEYGTLETKIKPIPLWFSIVPPLMAILMALLFKEVFVALFMGIFSGTFTIFWFYGFGFFTALGKGFFSIIDKYIIQALNNTGHLSIIVFSLMIGGMVHIITKNGGMRGIVNYLSKYAQSPRSGQLITWLLGIAIFFDDYANTLVVGNTMRPVTDKLNISREKLAYLVDSTAAPIASIALITTWIGAELSYIQDGIKMLNLDETPYLVFLHSLQYSFYPIFTLGFVLMLIIMGRDFGPMRKIEHQIKKPHHKELKATQKEKNDFNPKKGIKPRAINALIPVFTVVIGTMIGLFYTGQEVVGWQTELSFGRNLSEIIGHADSYLALLWSSLAGVTVAVILSMIQKLLSLKESMESMLDGFKLMLTAVLILSLAWALAGLTEDLHTAQFISGSLIRLDINPLLIPGLAFILAALVAFSTGSSWGTMAILYPLMLPAVWLLSQEATMNYQESLSLFHNVVAVVLAGSVFGDHCSPISDTTIMSSLASQCNHISHVQTQMPYALSVGAVSLFAGTIPVAYGLPIPLAFVFGFSLLFILIRFVGKKKPVQT